MNRQFIVEASLFLSDDDRERLCKYLHTELIYMPAYMTDSSREPEVELEFPETVFKTILRICRQGTFPRRFRVYVCEAQTLDSKVIHTRTQELHEYWEYLKEGWLQISVGRPVHMISLRDYIAQNKAREIPDQWMREQEQKYRQEQEHQHYLAQQQRMAMGNSCYRPYPMDGRGPMYPPGYSQYPIRNSGSDGSPAQSAEVEKPEFDTLMSVKADKEVKNFNVKFE